MEAAELEPDRPDRGDRATGISGYEVVREADERTETVANSTQVMLEDVACPTGKRVVGGGGEALIFVGNAFTGPADLALSAPITYGGVDHWRVGLAKRDGSYFAVGEGASWTVYAICGNVAA